MILEKEKVDRNKSKHHIFINKKKKQKLSRYITKAIVILNKDLKSLGEKLHQEETRYKLTEDGEIVANDFFEYDFSLSSQCCGYYFYWY